MDINSNLIEDVRPDVPDEVYYDIFSYLDLSDIRKAREVSKKWKGLVPNARPNLHFICHLTDKTFTFAVNSEEIFSWLEVYDFSGTGNEVMSPTSGTGFLFGNIDIIKFSGSNIAPAEIPKMMQFAVDSVNMLELKDCGIDTLRSFIDAKQTFNVLEELSIAYTNAPAVNTSALEGLATPEGGPMLPKLKCLKIFLDCPEQTVRPLPRDMLLNYLAIGKLIGKYRGTLKDLEIKRTSKLRSITQSAISHRYNPGNVSLLNCPILNQEFQQCLGAFSEMSLEKVCLSPENARSPFEVETQLLRRQQSLKELVIEEIVDYFDESPNLVTFLPTNGASLTSVKITFKYYAENVPVNLEAFRVCPNLKTLWLVLFPERVANWDTPIWRSTSRFSNVEALPNGITSLHFKCDNQDVEGRHWKKQLLILSPEQVQWITDNLKDVESLWIQLVLEPRRTGSNQQFVNGRPNVTLQTFKDLVSLPQLRNLKLDMLKFNQLEEALGGRNEDVVEDVEFDVYVVPLDEIQDYIDVSKSLPNVTSVSRYPVQSRYLRFWEVTIQK